MLYLKKLSIDDGMDVYNMLQEIGNNEFSFTNPVYKHNFAFFQLWLQEQANWEKGMSLPEGYVPQVVYWLYDDGKPAGFGKIRYVLTENSKESGGNIGYAISKQFRGKGYGTLFLAMLLEEAYNMGLKEILLTVDVENVASQKVCKNNGGKLISKNEKRYYFLFEKSSV